MPHIAERFDLCDVARHPILSNVSFMYPPMWRFLPLIDDQVIR